MKDFGNLKAAIVCDWLLGIGGAERVVLELHKLFPEAPIYTSQYDPSKIDWFKDADVRTTWLQHLPGGLKKFLPVLRAWTFSHLDLSEFDLVISATGAEAKAVKFGPNSTHVCYCFAPTHYYWSRYDEYISSPGFGALDPLARLGLKVLVGPMRRWDKRAAQKPTHMIGISTHIQQEINKYYARDSSVIFPPVDIERFRPKQKVERHGFVVAGRQTPYKRIDLAVAACTKLNLPLTVVGDGPEYKRLKSIAGSTITFVGQAPEADVPRYFQSAEGFIFPGLDDFGIVAVEALAAGAPVIAFKAGGALDYVVPGNTGLFFNEPTVNSLVKTLQTFDASNFNHESIAKSAEIFSSTNFRKQINDFIRKIGASHEQ